MLNPYCDGDLPRPADDPRRIAEERVLLAQAEYLAATTHPLLSYIKTHGPWDQMHLQCESCGRTLLAIHNDRLRCVSGERL